MASSDASNLPAPRRDLSPTEGGARRLSAGEVEEILRRAADAEVGTTLPAPHDPTLDDLVEAAREVGLDPASVRRAASLVTRSGSGPGVALAGGSDRHSARARSGAPLPDPEIFVDAVERALGVGGRLKEKPGELTWSSMGGAARTRVVIRESDDGTEVVAESDQAAVYFWSWLAAAGGWAAASALLGIGALGAGAWILSMLAVPVLAVRPFWARATRRRKLEMEQLVMDVLRAAEEADREEG